MKAFLIVMAMCCGLHCNAMLSNDTTVCVENLYYSLHGNFARVEPSRNIKYGGDIVIPEFVEYNGVKHVVVSIAEKAFQNCSIGNMVIPETVKEIGALAFAFCEIVCLQLPKQVDSIQTTAFYKCGGLTVDDGLRYAGDFLVGVADTARTTYRIKEGTRWIGSNAFNGIQLKTIVIPASVEEVGSFAFSGCTNLTKVSFVGPACKLLDYAFSSCSSLSDVELPERCVYGGRNVFRGSLYGQE